MSRYSEIPNLDTLEPDGLMAFWYKHQRGRKYKDLFPEGGTGTVKATRDLANYASNKATAMSCRERGLIGTALSYEAICDNIYAELPAFARW